MSYQANVLNVMIASPGDVRRERAIIAEAIHEWNAVHAESQRIVLMPLGWDTHAYPQLGARAQELINEQVADRCDLLVAVFWTRLGSPTGESRSGTVDEINRHVEAGKPAMIYFSNAPVRPDSVEGGQYAALREFKVECEERGLFSTFDDPADFDAQFRRQLSQTVINEFSELAEGLSVENVDSNVDGSRGTAAAEPDLSDDAKRLLVGASKDQNGLVLHLRALGGATIQANGIVLNERGDSRSEAQWEEAINELVRWGLLEPRGYQGISYAVTHAGYQLADQWAEAD